MIRICRFESVLKGFRIGDLPGIGDLHEWQVAGARLKK